MIDRFPEFLAINQRSWDERVPIHRRDSNGFYAVERFLAGEKRLHAIETGELGDISGKRLVHLQCHFGLDTLMLARHGAHVTGVDFSAPAIAEARALAEAIGVAADFVCCDVYAARDHVSGFFDVVYTSWGTICWLPDLAAWAKVIAFLLAPGGFFYFADAHPNMLILEERDGTLVHDWPLDTPPDQPLRFDEPRTYTGDLTPLAASQTCQWIHSMSRLVGALLDAGLSLEFLREHPTLPWPAFPMCVKGEDGLWRLPDAIPSFPLSVSLRARKPQT
jgi:SAM-dependent methyltransferase